MESKILDIENPIECFIVERINRFVVKVLQNGDDYRACINNTGRLPEFLVNGRRGFCVSHEKQAKTDYRLFAIEAGNLGAIIDTQLQMKAFEKSVEMELIPWLGESSVLKRNVRLGNSLIDYLLLSNGREIYLEVKSAVLRQGHRAMYPDCPSSRGRRHIQELTDHVKEGGKAVILFIAALPEVKAFQPNRAADPELSELLWEGYQAGVEIKSIGIYYNPENFSVCLFHPDLSINF